MIGISERCPNCGTDLSNVVVRYLYEGVDCKPHFEYKCGGCGAELEIEVAAIPQFLCTLKDGLTPVARGHACASDGDDDAESDVEDEVV